MKNLLVAILLSVFLFPKEIIGQNFCGTASDEPSGCLLNTTTYADDLMSYSTSPLISGISGTFCTSINKDAWLEFIPICSEVNFKFNQMICNRRIPSYGMGLSVLDENLEMVSICFLFPSIGFGGRTFSVKDLIPNKRYTLLIYAASPAQTCSYQFEAQGITTFGLNSQNIHGTFQIGEGSSTKYYVEDAGLGATYNWTVDAGVNIISGQGTSSIMVDAPQSGDYQLCCEITSSSGIENFCNTINVNLTDPIIQYEKGEFCKKECYDFFGNCYNESGHYYHQSTNADGRDVQNILELCRIIEPDVFIVGPTTHFVPNDQQATIVEASVSRSSGDVDIHWIDPNKIRIPNSEFTELFVRRPGTYCFVAFDNITGCSDTACVSVNIPNPIPEYCGVAGDEPPGCLLCTDTYVGSSAGFTPSPAHPDFCGTVENNQWIAIRADSTNIEISLRTWNCQNDDGMQMFMLDIDNNRVSTCFSTSRNVMGNIEAENLIVGEIYYLMLDGWRGDICDFEIVVLGGVDFGNPDKPEPIQPEQMDPCPGQTVCYEIPEIDNASFYEWRLAGGRGSIISGQGTPKICVKWSDSGDGKVCVLGHNDCFSGDTTCLDVIVENSTSLNNLPPQSFCPGAFPLSPSQYCAPGATCPGVIPSPGIYCVSVGQSVGQCDSTVCYTFEEISINQTILDTIICSGNCITMQGIQICNADTLQIKTPTVAGCEDILEIRVQEINLDATIVPTQFYDCELEEAVPIEIQNPLFGFGIRYQWTALDGGIIESGENSSLAMVKGVGRYALEMSYGQGANSCIARDTVTLSGQLAAPDISCMIDGNSLIFSWDSLPGANFYDITIDGTQYISIDTFFRVTGLAPLQQVEIQVSGNGFFGCFGSVSIESCVAADCPTVDVQITPVNAICFGQNLQTIQLDYTTIGGTGSGNVVWSGQGVNIDGTFNPNGLAAGIYPINLTYSENGCDYLATTNIEILEKPNADFTLQSPICLTDFSEIIYTGSSSSNANFQWDFGGGISNAGSNATTHQVNWSSGGTYNISLQVTENGCASDPIVKTVEVEEPIDKPVLQCNSTTSTVEIIWADVSDATGYQVNLISGATGTQSGNSYLVENLNPGDEITISVTAETDNTCGPTTETITCEAKDCPPIVVSINPIPDLCFDTDLADFDLKDFLSLSGNNANATISWSSNGTLANPSIFSPVTNGEGDYNIEVTISDSGCEFSATAGFKIKPKPEAEFDVTPKVCIDEVATVSFTSPISNISNFNWNFDGGNELSGNSDQGPYQLTFSTPGFKNIELLVEEDGCQSEPSNELIEVVAPLLPPVISCVTGTSEITFTWNQIPGATDYNLSLVDTLPGITLTQNGGFELVATDLNPMDELTLVIEVSDNNSPCPPTIITETCEAQNCPPINISLDAVPQICLDEGTTGATIDLNDYLQITGDNGNPTIKWSGNSVINPTGIFEPNTSNLGAQQVLVEVSEDGCDFSNSLIINVFENPKSEFKVDSPICITDKSEAALTNTPLPGTTFFWDFGNANTQSGTSDEGPHDLTWSTSRTDQISLYTEKDNCQSDITVLEIIVQEELTPPTIQCVAGTDNILFEWSADPSILDYQVSVDDAPIGYTTNAPNAFSFLVENLAPSDEVTITVFAENNQSACPTVSTTETCVVSPCPQIDEPKIRCAPDLTEILFEWDPIPGLNSYEVNVDNGPAGLSTNQPDDFSILISDLLPSDEVEITVKAWNDQTACPPVSTTFTCETLPCPNIDFDFQTIPDICLSNTVSPINLNDFVTITSDLNNGIIEWSGVGTTIDGIFNPTTADIGQHDIELTFQALNCEKKESMTINIHPLPIADAGEDVEVSCFNPMVTIGGAGNQTNSTEVEYTWSGGSVMNVNSFQTQTDIPGTYILTSVNSLTGCTSTDQVTVTQGALAPILSSADTKITCYGFNDGSIILEDVAEGTPPFLFSIDGGPFEAIDEYKNLAPGVYQIKVVDAEGCEDEVNINIEEPNELAVDLSIFMENDPVILGDSISLTFSSNFNEDLLNSIQWFGPDLIAECLAPDLDDCLGLTLFPTQNTTYQVRIETENGCFATVEDRVRVIKDLKVYIPSAFSPNNDGINDILKIYANPNRIKSVKTFQIFNRWGESVYRQSDFSINEDHGWDGFFRGKKMGSNVFVYLAEIEFLDGSTEILKGDVTLLR